MKRISIFVLSFQELKGDICGIQNIGDLLSEHNENICWNLPCFPPCDIWTWYVKHV